MTAVEDTRILVAGALLAALGLIMTGPGCDDTPADGPCRDVTCSNHGTCVVEGGLPLCECDSGYRPAGQLSCVAEADGDADGDGDGDADPTWVTEVVASDGVGRYSSIDVDADGTVGVGYYGFDARNDGICDEVSGEQPPRTFFPVHYAHLAAGSASWETEQVTETLHLTAPAGLSFRFAPDGTPGLALYSGDPIDVLCSANDAVYATRAPGGTWSFETAAADSGQAAPTDDESCNASASTAGYTVGEWPALAIDSSGDPAILYRDTHFGGMQRDDIARADAELAYRQGGWSQEMVDCGAGGGRDNAVAFDSEDRLVALHRITRESQIESRHGLWAHRRQTDGTWLQLRLAQGMVDLGERSITATADGAVAAVYYDPSSGHAWLAELEDPVRFADAGSWAPLELGNDSYNEGLSPAIGQTASGTLAVAYYRCAATGVETCSPAQDGVIFGWRSGSGSWRWETVDEGANGECGTNLSLAIGPDGSAWISYVCVRHLSGSDFVEELKVARRRPLP